MENKPVFEEKARRYEAVRKLLDVTNYMTDDELAQIAEITDRCNERFKDFQKQNCTNKSF